MSKDTVQPHSLIHSLMQPGAYDPPAEKCELIETHISWVILAGPYAYKIKKALNLGFLDFSTLEKRRFFCHEELRLNKRLAPSIYLSVVPITGSVEQPQWAGEGKAIEYAVKMRAFPQQAQFDRVLALNGLKSQQIDVIARHIASFHNLIDVAGADSPYGNPDSILQPVEENFLQIREHGRNSKALPILSELEDWSRGTFESLRSFFVERKTSGFVRECHGDLHLRNIAWLDDGPVIFDCIEFSPGLRWIDVMNDIAFLVMDLQERGHPAFARRFLNDYLEDTGDYGGIPGLRFYLAYRALVRAKIDAIRADQAGVSKKELAEAEQDFLEYLDLALDYFNPAPPKLLITHGMSASGKSAVSRLLLEHVGAIRIRSDVERKRLFGIKADTDGRSAVGEGIYTAEATKRTYQKLEELAALLLDAGYTVIVDAVFSDYVDREKFRQLALSRKVPFVILQCRADIEILRQRIGQREKEVSDADLQVLEMQYSRWQPLHDHERPITVTVDTAATIDIDSLASMIETIASS